MTYTTGKEKTKPVEVQERTYRIVKNFIRCATCVRNLDLNQMQHGFFVKNYCNYLKQKIVSCFDPAYDIEQDRKKAQNCSYYLPESMTVAADLSDLQPYEIKNSVIDLPEQHAEGLEKLFASKKDH